ncbi:MAG: hypothetical protein M3014_03790 [Chloroflexota bacterium]|nr:hypothetical protein [Chloroflexota bacterium]
MNFPAQQADIYFDTQPSRAYIIGVQDPSSLWSQIECQAWHTALESYLDVVARQQVNGLEELDRWYREDFPALLRQRDPQFITLDELTQVARWKMKRGVWRQRNLMLVEGNSDDVVKERSEQAFAVESDPRKPIALLSDLSGVGPATASAVMAAGKPDRYPFFDELVAAQVAELGAVAFTAAYYARYTDALRERTLLLNDKCSHVAWKVQEVSQALWAASGGKSG